VKKLFFILLSIVCFSFAGKAQKVKVDSIFFNLYTDSLKKGPLHYNYINVDGKLSDGSYLPLDSTQVKFSSSAGKMTGNVLQLDSAMKEEYVTVTATLIENPAIRKEIRIYIKKVVAEEKLKKQEELIEGWQKKKNN
jgi:hypothetical protein